MDKKDSNVDTYLADDKEKTSCQPLNLAICFLSFGSICGHPYVVILCDHLVKLLGLLH
jgi:hypothetical protein